MSLPPEEQRTEEIRRRQRGQSIAMAIALALFAVLMFAITVTRMAMR